MNTLPANPVILPAEYEASSPRPTNAIFTNEFSQFHFRKSSMASSKEQSMFHLLATLIGEDSAIALCDRAGWSVTHDLFKSQIANEL